MAMAFFFSSLSTIFGDNWGSFLVDRPVGRKPYVVRFNSDRLVGQEKNEDFSLSPVPLFRSISFTLMKNGEQGNYIQYFGN